MTTAPPKSGAVVFAKDVERVAAFYRETMALAVEQQDDGFVVLGSAATELVVHAIPPAIAAQIDIAVPPRPREDASVKLIFPVADLAAARAAACAHGGQIEPAEREWEWRGYRICDGVDPEGNVVQIRANVAGASRTRL